MRSSCSNLYGSPRVHIVLDNMGISCKAHAGNDSATSWEADLSTASLYLI